MRFISLVLSFILLIAFVACGDDDDTSDPDAFAALAQERVQDVLLVPEDLGTDWVTTNPDSDLTASIDLSAECDILEPNVIFPGAVAAERSDPMAGSLSQQVISYGAIYADETAAAAALDRAPDLVDRCEDEFKETAREVASNLLDALGVDLGTFANIDVTIEPLDIAGLGDQSLAYRLLVSVGILGNNQHFTLDVAAVRQGRTVGGATYTTFGEPLVDDEAMVLEKLSEKVAAVEEDF